MTGDQVLSRRRWILARQSDVIDAFQDDDVRYARLSQDVAVKTRKRIDAGVEAKREHRSVYFA